MQVRFADFKAQRGYYFCTWNPRDRSVSFRHQNPLLLPMVKVAVVVVVGVGLGEQKCASGRGRGQREVRN